VRVAVEHDRGQHPDPEQPHRGQHRAGPVEQTRGPRPGFPACDLDGPVQPQHPPQLADHPGVGLARARGDGRRGPADPRVLRDLDPEFLGECLELRVVPPPLPTGVLDVADVNPMAQAEPPPAPKPNPQPPTAAQAARIMNESWRDPDWGSLVWTAMTTGVRRGEMCAIRVSSVDLDEGRETVWLRRAIRREPGAGWVEADLKTHQQRRIALDAETVVVLRQQIERCRARAEALGFEYPADGFLFSGSADGSTFLTPDSVTQRYDRMVSRIGIETTIHKLRHYSATELIAGGVDPRTVAGRLGHGGGGTTTLKAYSAWVSEADQRAAKGLGAGMPERPAGLDEADRIKAEPRYPYQAVAAAVVRQVADGTLPPGLPAPPAAELATRHGVSLATAKRSLVLLTEWGTLARHGRNELRVVGPATVSQVPLEPDASPTADYRAGTLLALTLRRRGTEVARFSTVADPASASELHEVLAAAVARAGGAPHEITDYEMDVRLRSESVPMLTFVTSSRTS